MELMAYRILDTLARSLGEALSMRALAKRIEAVHGTGSYPNVHAALQELEGLGVVRFEVTGRAHAVHLDIGASRDALAQRDLQRYQEFLEQYPRIIPLAENLHRCLFNHSASGFLVDPERGVKANRLTLLLVSDSGHNALLEEIHELEKRHQTPIDAAPLRAEDLATLAQAREWNPVPDWIRSGIAFHHPQGVWEALRQVKAWPKPGSPPVLREILGALPHLGYRELGEPITKRRIGVEEVATALLSTGEARRIAASAVILAKTLPHPGLLHALAKRRGVAGEILALLRFCRPQDHAIGLFVASGAVEASLDRAHIESTLAKYAGP